MIFIFYDINKIMSYNAILNFIIGERGVGKSYGAKKYVAKRFIKKKKQFAYIRRYKTELHEALYKGKEPIFFNQILNDDELHNHKFNNTKSTFYIDDKIAGYAMPLSTANILKSATYEEVDTIIFDEFIIDKGCYKYLHNEVDQILDLIETIGRMRDIKILFLGNAITISNPYFNYFNLHLPYNSEFQTFKDGLIVVNYIKNLKYRECKKQTRFGKLIDGTNYGKYAIDNEMLRDSKTFIDKKTKKSKYYFTLIHNQIYYGVWYDMDVGKMFISSKYDPLYKTIITMEDDSHNYNTILTRSKNSPFIKSLIVHYQSGQLYFENQNIKNIFHPSLIKLI